MLFSYIKWKVLLKHVSQQTCIQKLGLSTQSKTGLLMLPHPINIFELRRYYKKI